MALSLTIFDYHIGGMPFVSVMVLLIRAGPILMIEISKWQPLARLINANREVWRQV